MRGLYTLAIRLYATAVRTAALGGNDKAKLWVNGRKQWPEGNADPAPWVWFHAASLGEFEQGRPLIEALKKQYPDLKVSLTFFSPSGYEIRKNYPLADEVLYLPIDTPKNARQWVKRHRFVATFFIKYEFWFNYMNALAEEGIPLYYISLILKPKQFFFRWYGGWFRKQLKAVTHFFVQDDRTLDLLHSIHLDNATRCGDTRFDRVADIAQQIKRFPEIEAFISHRNCIIAGSSWPPDERLLLPYLETLPEDYCMIIAPHNISETHIRQLTERLDNYQLYTEIHPERQTKILVLNTIGMLSQLYQYARFVYIGGGFGVNIHNIQEPVTFGCPVVFGPKYESFKEAVDLVNLAGAFTIKSQDELNKIFDRLISDETFYSRASETCKNYLESQLGATQIILQKITSTFSF